MEEQVVINARVANRNYKIKVNSSNEGFVREQLSLIAEKLHSFKLNFSGRDEQDYMAMVLLEYVTTASSKESVPNDTWFEQELLKISNLLDR